MDPAKGKQHSHHPALCGKDWVMMDRRTPFFHRACRSAFALASLLLLARTVCFGADLALESINGRTARIGEGIPVMVTVIDDKQANAARRAGDLVSDEAIAHRQILQVTVVNFQNRLQPSMHRISKAQMELDLKKAATRLVPIYRRLGVSHSPNDDLYAIADFDGSVSGKLGVDSAQDPVVVLLYDGRGRPVARFNGVPGPTQFARHLQPLLASGE